MAMMSGVRSWLETFPGLSGGELHMDFLPPEARAFSLDSVPAGGTVKSYMDGSSVRQLLFVLSSREFYDDSAAQNAENGEFYERLADWLEERTRSGELPELGEGKLALRAEAVSAAYPIAADGHGAARYQIQCRIEYYREGKR